MSQREMKNRKSNLKRELKNKLMRGENQILKEKVEELTHVEAICAIKLVVPVFNGMYLTFLFLSKHKFLKRAGTVLRNFGSSGVPDFLFSQYLVPNYVRIMMAKW